MQIADPHLGPGQSIRRLRATIDDLLRHEPDLVLLRVDDDWLAQARSELPELPDAKIDRLEADYGIPRYDAGVLAAERPLADYFEATATAAGDNKLASNWVMVEVLRALKERGIPITEFPVAPELLARLLRMLRAGKVSGSAAKEVFDEMVERPRDPAVIVEEENLSQLSDESDLREDALRVIRDNPKPYNQYKGGKEAVFGFFVGQLMKATRGRANPQVAKRLLRELLDAPELPDG